MVCQCVRVPTIGTPTMRQTTRREAKRRRIERTCAVAIEDAPVEDGGDGGINSANVDKDVAVEDGEVGVINSADIGDDFGNFDFENTLFDYAPRAPRRMTIRKSCWRSLVSQQDAQVVEWRM